MDRLAAFESMIVQTLVQKKLAFVLSGIGLAITTESFLKEVTSALSVHAVWFVQLFMQMHCECS